jgi:type IV pilus assembly protein PilV
MDRIPGSRTQHGISLVESLVALLVMSVGMLGIASLYVTSLKTGRSALTRTHAVNLVNDLADRIRANSKAQGAYAFVSSTPQNPTDVPNCSQQGCSAADIAKVDLADWRMAIQRVLPAGATGTVQYVPSPNGLGRPDTYRVSVKWNEPGEDKDLSYDINMQLIAVKP